MRRQWVAVAGAQEDKNPFLVRIRTDPKTVQTLLRHSDVKLTLQCYTHSVSEDRMAAAGAMLTAIFSHATDRSGLKAD